MVARHKYRLTALRCERAAEALCPPLLCGFWLCCGLASCLWGQFGPFPELSGSCHGLCDEDGCSVLADACLWTSLALFRDCEASGVLLQM